MFCASRQILVEWKYLVNAYFGSLTVLTTSTKLFLPPFPLARINIVLLIVYSTHSYTYTDELSQLQLY